MVKKIVHGLTGFLVGITVLVVSAQVGVTRGAPLSGSGDALTTSPLSQFAATTSAQLAGVISDETGSGKLVFGTSPTLTTPVLGVATATSINKVTITAPTASATLTIADGKTLTVSNILTFTGTDSSSVAFGTGGTVAYTANNLSVFAATTSAQLLGVLSDETGTGAAVFANTPTLVTPNIGAATGTSVDLSGDVKGATFHVGATAGADGTTCTAFTKGLCTTATAEDLLAEVHQLQAQVAALGQRAVDKR